MGAAEQVDRGSPKHSQIADREQNAQLRGTHFEVRDFEVAQGIAGEINLHGEHEISNKQAQSDDGIHVSRESEPAEKEECTEGVHYVVNVKAIARTRMVAKTSQSAIERVTKPVKSQTQND